MQENSVKNAAREYVRGAIVMPEGSEIEGRPVTISPL